MLAQYAIFIYKYNILTYLTITIVAELVLLTLLLGLNAWRFYLGKAGNKGKRYGMLFGFIGLDVLVIVGEVYLVALQISALYLEIIMGAVGLAFSGVGLIMCIVLIIFYRASE